MLASVSRVTDVAPWLRAHIRSAWIWSRICLGTMCKNTVRLGGLPFEDRCIDPWDPSVTNCHPGTQKDARSTLRVHAPATSGMTRFKVWPDFRNWKRSSFETCCAGPLFFLPPGNLRLRGKLGVTMPGNMSWAQIWVTQLWNVGNSLSNFIQPSIWSVNAPCFFLKHMPAVCFAH